MVFMVDTSEDGGLLRLGGELKIETAGELKSILGTLLEKTNDLTLDMQKVTGIDLSCLQLFCAANRAFLAMNRGFTLLDNGGAPEVLITALRDAGYTRGQCVTENYCKTCLWKEVGQNV